MIMENTSGLYKILSNPLIYEAYQSLSGGSRARRSFIEDYTQIRPKESVVEIGCGPGNLLDYMPRDMSYVGIDVSSSYINAARKHHGDRGKFIEADCDLAGQILPPESADTVICCGVLHHINDTVIKSVLLTSHRLLKSGGRFLCLEPVWLLDHPFISRIFMKCDRGKNIKTEKEWLQIARSVFPNVVSDIRIDLFILPYYVVIVTCSK